MYTYKHGLVKYSQTPLIRTLKGPNRMVCVLSGVNLEKGTTIKAFFSQGKSKLFIRMRCPFYAVARKVGFNCTKFGLISLNLHHSQNTLRAAGGNYITCRKNYNLLFLLFLSYLLSNTLDRAVSF